MSGSNSRGQTEALVYEHRRMPDGEGITAAQSPIDVALDLAIEEIERAISLRLDAVQRIDIVLALERVGEVFRRQRGRDEGW